MSMSLPVESRIAVFGGAFDPPHQAHIFAVTTLLMRSDISEVWLLPTYQHVFDKDMTDFDVRCRWLDTCVQSAGWSQRVSICKIERDQGGQSRTYDTLSELERRFPDHRFCFVIGADNLAVSHKWYRFDDLVERWPLIVFGRPGYERALEDKKDEAWCVPEVCLPPLSSTSVRDGLSVKIGESLRQVPPPIRDSIRQHFNEPFSTQSRDDSRIYILGLGRVGSSLKHSLTVARRSVLGWSRTDGPLREWLTANPPQQGDVFVLTVPDQCIEDIAHQLADVLDSTHVVIHCAGMLAPVKLAAIPASQTGVMHPIRSIATRDVNLAHTHWGVFGGVAAHESIRRILQPLSGYVLAIEPGQHHLYHAAMVTMGNFPAGLVAAAQEMMSGICADESEMGIALFALMGSAFENLKSQDVSTALTGPVARRDLATIQQHFVALKRVNPEMAQWYRLSSLRLAEVVEWKTGIKCLSATDCGVETL